MTQETASEEKKRNPIVPFLRVPEDAKQEPPQRHDFGERVENVHFASEGHDFGPSKRREVYRFFARHLELEPLEEALQEIEIEAHEQMAVFDKNHPLPDYAAKGSEQIKEAFARLCDVPNTV